MTAQSEKDLTSLACGRVGRKKPFHSWLSSVLVYGVGFFPPLSEITGCHNQSHLSSVLCIEALVFPVFQCKALCSVSCTCHLPILGVPGIISWFLTVSGLLYFGLCLIHAVCWSPDSVPDYWHSLLPDIMDLSVLICVRSSVQ